MSHLDLSLNSIIERSESEHSWTSSEPAVVTSSILYGAKTPLKKPASLRSRLRERIAQRKQERRQLEESMEEVDRSIGEMKQVFQEQCSIEERIQTKIEQVVKVRWLFVEETAWLFCSFGR